MNKEDVPFFHVPDLDELYYCSVCTTYIQRELWKELTIGEWVIIICPSCGSLRLKDR